MCMENQIIIAMKALILHEHKILLVKRSCTDSISPESWEFVGGKLEFGEDLEEGLIREIQEETGLTVHIEKMLYATTFKTHETRQVVIINYLCHTLDCKVQLSDEHDDFIWVGERTMRSIIPKRMLQNLEKNHIFEQLELAEE